VPWLAGPRRARAAADRLDSVSGRHALAKLDFEVEATPEDLRPFLGEWSPHRPQREYRTESDEKRLAEEQLYAREWHHGMRGRSDRGTQRRCAGPCAPRLSTKRNGIWVWGG
jgi:hypothetical protein